MKLGFFPNLFGAVTPAVPQHSLSAVFSQFGLLYGVRVFPNAAAAPPGFYALVKLYSAQAAHKAQRACNQKPLFQSSPVKAGRHAGFSGTRGVRGHAGFWTPCEAVLGRGT